MDDTPPGADTDDRLAPPAADATPSAPEPAAAPRQRRDREPRDPRTRRRQLVALIAGGVLLIVLLLLVGLVRSRDQGPPFTGRVSAPGGGRTYRVTGWSRGDAAPIERAQAAEAIDEVDFVWYLARDDGSIVAENEDLDLVRATRKRGAQALATVVNRTAGGDFDGDIAAAILASPDSRRRHVDALVDLAVDKGYDGIDIDWEMVRPADRDRFTEFIELLADALHHEDRILSIAAFPKTSEPGQYDLQKPYDYKRLGAAVDEFKIMTYSFSGSWGGPGPQTPLDWADEVLGFAADQLPARKTYLGVPFYGFDWHGEATDAVYPGRAAELVAASDPKIGRDADSREATFRFTDPDGVEHTVFFQDKEAIAAKLELLRDKHPHAAGIAIWQLYDEDPVFWKVIRARLRKK